MRTLVQYLRLMRFPLVFTAIGDAWAVRWLGDSPPSVAQLAVLAGISFCLYGLGMVLNDVMDARRDAGGQPHKPIPSGGVSRAGGAAFAVVLAGGAVWLGLTYQPPALMVVLVAGAMIVGYDVGLKKSPVIGLLLLGLIRATHCQISGVGLGLEDRPPLLPGTVLAGWVSAFLFTHVTVVSWIAYDWEGKKPAVRLVRRWVLAFLIVAINMLAIGTLGLNRPDIHHRLIPPLAAGLVYAVLLLWVLASKRFPAGPDKGRMAMRLGLIWLLVYDAAFLAAAGRWSGVAAMAALLALLLGSSRGLIWLGRRTGLGR